MQAHVMSPGEGPASPISSQDHLKRKRKRTLHNAQEIFLNNVFLRFLLRSLILLQYVVCQNSVQKKQINLEWIIEVMFTFVICLFHSLLFYHKVVKFGQFRKYHLYHSMQGGQDPHLKKVTPT